MWCSNKSAYVDEDDCYDCGEGCDMNNEKARSEEEKKETTDRLLSSELATEIKRTLTKSLGLEDADVDRLTENLFNQAFKAAEGRFTICLNNLAEKKATEYIERKAKKMLDDAFDKAMAADVLLFMKDEKIQVTKIQKLIGDKMMQFFANKDARNSRSYTEDTVDKAIAKSINSLVEESLAELQEETVEKFNKEAMKKMMTAMVGAIQTDKKLMAVMGS